MKFYKNKMLLFLILFLIFLSCSNLKLYKSQFYSGFNYQIKVQGKYKVFDKNRWDVYFSSAKDSSFVNIKILNINIADNKQGIAEIFKRLYLLEGNYSERKTCNYDEVYGEFLFTKQKEPSENMMLFSIINNEYFYYFLSFYGNKAELKKNRKLFDRIIKSFKIRKCNNIDINKEDECSEYFNFKIRDDKNSIINVYEKDYSDSVKEFEEFYSSQIDFLPVNIYDSDYNFILKSRVYQEMYSLNYDRLDLLIEYYLNIKIEKNLGDKKIISYILTSLQKIPYKRPMDLEYGNIHKKEIDYFTPLEVLYYNCGDCDSKSVLLLIILKKLGYDAVILFSDEYNHVMTGINYNIDGDYVSYNNKKYYFLETIKPYWEIGKLPEQFKDKSKWKIIPIY